MTNTVTVNGNLYADDSTTGRYMGSGGHRLNLIPMLSDTVIDLSAKVAAAAASVTTASGYVATVTTQAGIATTQAGISTAQAAIATTQAGNSSTYATNSSNSATLASQWASTTGLLVNSTDYSAKEWSVGITTRGMSGKGSAKDWATLLSATVDGTDYSAKYWAQYAASFTTGQMIYMGTWNASSGSYPGSPVKGAFWKTATAGTTGGVYYAINDDAVYNGTTWDKIDNSKFVILYYDWSSRSSLRSAAGNNGDHAVISGLGLFVFVASSTEPDDDETCFAATGGCWELAAASWDIAFAYWLADIQMIQDDVLALQVITTNHVAKSIYTTMSQTLTSLASNTSYDYTVAVAGAVVGGTVICNTSTDGYGSSATDKSKLSFNAYISAANTVIVSLRNASASTAALVAGTWNILVINQ